METMDLAQKFLDTMDSGMRHNMLRNRDMMPLRPGEFALLAYLDRNEENRDIKVSDISRFMGVTPPTVTPVVSRLEEKGFLNREVDRNDRRVTNLVLTQKGRTMIRDCMQRRLQTTQALIAFLGNEDALEVIRLLERVIQFEQQALSREEP